MSRDRFITLVRGYARLAERTHKSFGDQVQTCYELRLSSILRDYKDEQNRKKEIAWTNQAMERNYASVDPRWTFTPTPFDWTEPMG